LKQFIKSIFQKFGYDIVRFPGPPIRKELLESHKIDVILDVGANTGQFAKGLRRMGYQGRIISFEPLSSAYSELKCNSEKDAFWEAFNFALGDIEKAAVINIASNSYSSSILMMLPSHIKLAPESEYVGQEEIKVKTLDSLFSSLCNQADNILLKIDTQGYEKCVIMGAEKTLEFIDVIQLEMSLTPLYKDELLFDKMYELLSKKGYKLVGIEPEFIDIKTGHMLQVNGIFTRC